MSATTKGNREPKDRLPNGRIPHADLRPNCRIWIYSTEHGGVFGDGKIRLLEAVDRFGSLRDACAELDISYRKAWGDLKKAESCLGVKLVETVRGGADGGQTRLTDDGRKAVAAYGQMRRRIQASLDKSFALLVKDITT